MRQLRSLALLLLLAVILPCAHAQKNPGAPSNAPFALGGIGTPPTPTSAEVRQVTLGNSTIPLDGLWKFHIGDSPQATGAKGMAWAQPGFDDSAWGAMDLTPPPGSYDPTLGSSGFVPGWTARGYKGYSGYAWYRLRVNVQDGQSALALKMPDNFDDAYQIYVNGQLVGEFGRFTAHGVTAYNVQPRAFPLPAALRAGPVVLAIRMYMEPFTPLVDPDAGGLHGPPVLGQASAIAGLLHLDWDAVDRHFYSGFFEMAILLLALLVAFGLYWLDRKEPAYLWLGLTCAVLLAVGTVVVLDFYTTWFDASLGFLFLDAVLTPASIGLWVLFWAYWFRLGGMARVHRIVWGLAVLLGLGTAMLRAPLYGSVVPVHASVWLSPLTLALKLLLGVLLVWVTVRGIRRNRTEGWLALPPVVLVGLSLYQTELSVLHVPTGFFPLGVAISMYQSAIILSLAIITVLLLRRFLHTQREREQWKLEIEQARQVQSLLVPNTAPAMPGFAIESVYYPAQQVGGDFFHLRPGEDGSLLVVAGDISGKGLKAAMTVSVVVGALRDYPERQPAEILAHLNRVLHGQMKGFATCCACLIAANGMMTISNAGHIPPYCNGETIGVPGDTPLGILSDGKYEEHLVQLQAGDRLTFVSDGIVEAMNEKRELFGFERTQQISSRPAAEIASVAQTFGQQDDITVLSVMLTPIKAPRHDPAILPAPNPSPV
jgi:hypothetical protein